MDTEQRLDRLELFAEDVKHRLARIEARLDVIEAQLVNMNKFMATKEDIANLRAEMAQMELRMLRWFVGTAITLSTAVFAIVKFIH